MAALVILASVAAGTFLGQALARPADPVMSRSNRLTYKFNRRFQIALVKDNNGIFSPEEKLTSINCAYKADGTGATADWDFKRMRLSKDGRILTLVFDTRKPRDKEPEKTLTTDNESGNIRISLEDDGTPIDTGEIPVLEVDINPCN
jgi:hypothetical protein